MADVNLKLDYIKYGDQTYIPPPEHQPTPQWLKRQEEETKEQRKTILGHSVGEMPKAKLDD